MVLPNFQYLLRVCGITSWEKMEQTSFEVGRNALRAMFQEIARNITFDEAWYLRNYKDVAKAVAEGHLPSGREHYIHFGYFEGRLPGLNGFDSETYCRSHADLFYLLEHPQGINLAAAHFIDYGYREGRPMPSKPGIASARTESAAPV